MAKKKTITKSDIISIYMEYALEHNENPKAVFAFAKANNFEETKFYSHFSSFDAIEKQVFNVFFANTTSILVKSGYVLESCGIINSSYFCSIVA